MSYWTHITASIDIDSHIEDKNIVNIIKDKLKDAPTITGSEGNAEIFVNVLSGHNVLVTTDCNSCKYKNTIIRFKNGYICEVNEGFECPDNKYQTRVVITIVGDLRDMVKNQTKEEYSRFIKYIKKDLGFSIRNQSVNITD